MSRSWARKGRAPQIGPSIPPPVALKPRMNSSVQSKSEARIADAHESDGCVAASLRVKTPKGRSPLPTQPFGISLPSLRRRQKHAVCQGGDRRMPRGLNRPDLFQPSRHLRKAIHTSSRGCATMKHPSQLHTRPRAPPPGVMCFLVCGLCAKAGLFSVGFVGLAWVPSRFWAKIKAGRC